MRISGGWRGSFSGEVTVLKPSAVGTLPYGSRLGTWQAWWKVTAGRWRMELNRPDLRSTFQGEDPHVVHEMRHHSARSGEVLFGLRDGDRGGELYPAA